MTAVTFIIRENIMQLQIIGTFFNLNVHYLVKHRSKAISDFILKQVDSTLH